MADLITRIVRTMKVGAVAGVAVGVVRSLRGDRKPPTTGQATWAPLTVVPPHEPRTGPVQFTATAAPSTTVEPTTEPVAPVASEPAATEPDASEPVGSWVEPVDGVCPITHPIKGNAGSGIFHVPGGMSYDRTIPERCYATEDDAIADGYRKAKR